MRGLNLSKFKKMAEDKNSAVLIHKDGHKLVIAKMSLPHAQRKQLEALETHEGYDEGGQVQSDNSGFTPTGQEAQFQNQDQSPITDQNIKQLNDINSG